MTSTSATVFVFDSLVITDYIDRSQYFHQETKDYYIVNIVVSKKHIIITYKRNKKQYAKNTACYKTTQDIPGLAGALAPIVWSLPLKRETRRQSGGVEKRYLLMYYTAAVRQRVDYTLLLHVTFTESSGALSLSTSSRMTTFRDDIESALEKQSNAEAGGVDTSSENNHLQNEDDFEPNNVIGGDNHMEVENDIIPNHFNEGENQGENVPKGYAIRDPEGEGQDVMSSMHWMLNPFSLEHIKNDYLLTINSKISLHGNVINNSCIVYEEADTGERILRTLNDPNEM
ncbi:hypothetical protein EAG_01361 [Camponotus floridanus]|uniref:Uncharacterized protein n=1 Tax=Camponotus floridanus TaxID=104421 RepID=E1ZW19_CAMFO|nr:hypothetical protein EAG_01361 [Camponotus floridanus]